MDEPTKEINEITTTESLPKRGRGRPKEHIKCKKCKEWIKTNEVHQCEKTEETI